MRKQTEEELKNTHSQLIQTAKLASIGELASGVAHELNQPLMVIRTTSQLLMRKLQKKESDIVEVMEQLGLIERNTKRMMNIINHLRTFSRQSQKEFSSVDINNVIENCFLMVGEQIRLRSIETEKDLERYLPEVQGDANQLEQVILNLITNAADAIMSKAEDGVWNSKFTGKIKIVSRHANSHQKMVEILIEDNGGGISAVDLQRIFDPFFTTKEVGKGTGLGLSICYGIIQDHGGEIGVDETNSEGTIFKVNLPIDD